MTPNDVEKTETELTPGIEDDPFTLSYEHPINPDGNVWQLAADPTITIHTNELPLYND